jgi:methionyl aminopeptidase
MDADSRLVEYRSQGFIVPGIGFQKTNEQIEGIRKSGVVTKGILDYVESKIKAGVTTDDINTWVNEYTESHNGIPAPLNYEGFPKSVCTSINDVICHGIPDDTVLKDGDIINVDVTTIVDGYYSDASRMFKIGNVSKEASDLVDVTKECLMLGINAIKPYVSVYEIGRAIEPYAKEHGYSVVRDYGGHGVGLAMHEEPHVDHYAKVGKGMILLPGMVITVEPMLNAGSYETAILDDDWTAVTMDGSLSAQWEHTIVVTETGFEILT